MNYNEVGVVKRNIVWCQNDWLLITCFYAWEFRFVNSIGHLMGHSGANAYEWWRLSTYCYTGYRSCLQTWGQLQSAKFRQLAEQNMSLVFEDAKYSDVRELNRDFYDGYRTQRLLSTKPNERSCLSKVVSSFG